MKVKKAGFILPNVIVAILFWVTAFAGSAYLGSRIVDDYRAYVLTRQCDVLDSALIMYAKTHRAVAAQNVRMRTNSEGKEVMSYTTGAIYPANLKLLGTVRDEQGYFSQEIDLSKFSYSTKKDSNGNMIYSLGVTMPNGYFYTSPHSGK